MFNSAYTSCENFFKNAYKKCKSAIDQIPVIGSLRRRRNAQGTKIKCNQMLHHKTQYKLSNITARHNPKNKSISYSIKQNLALK